LTNGTEFGRGVRDGAERDLAYAKGE